MQQTTNQSKTTKSYPLNEMELSKSLGYSDLHEYRAMLDKSISGQVNFNDWVSLKARPAPVLIENQYFKDMYNRNGYWLIVRGRIASHTGLTRQDFLQSVNKDVFHLMRNFYVSVERVQRFRDAISDNIELDYQYCEYSLSPNANDSIELRDIKSVLLDRYHCTQKLEALLEECCQLRISKNNEPDECKTKAIADVRDSIQLCSAELTQLPQAGSTYAEYTPRIFHGKQKIQLEQELMRAKKYALESFELLKDSVAASDNGNIESLSIENLLDFCFYVATLQGDQFSRWDRIVSMPLN